MVTSLAIAATSVMATSGVLSGFQTMLEHGSKGWIGDMVIVPADDETTLRHGLEIMADVKTLQYVQGATIRSTGSGMLRYQEKFFYPTLAGIEVAGEAAVTGLPSEIVEGSFLSENRESQSIVLGLNTADGLIGTAYDGERVPVGSTVDLLTKDGTFKSYSVKGIIDGKTFLPNWSIFLQKDELERVAPSQNNSIILVKVSDPSKLERVKLTIQERHPDTIVHTWQEESGYVEDILVAVRYITFLIITLLITSVFVVISIVIFININQEKRQIGIIKSMGATNRFIRTIYVTEAVVYFILSYILGFIVFMFLHSYSVKHPAPMLIGDFHTVIVWKNIMISFSILLLASFIGGFIPSFFITRSKIIDAIRNI